MASGRSFCGFCGAKASDSGQFCSDCGSKLEQSVEVAPPTHNTLPGMPSEPNILFSKSFNEIIRKEASIGKEITPSVAFSPSFAEILTGGLHGDTLQETPRVDAKTPTEESPTTLPDFVPAASFAEATTNKLPKTDAPDDGLPERTQPDTPRFVPQEPQPSVLLSKSLQEIPLSPSEVKRVLPVVPAPLAKVPMQRIDLPPRSSLLSGAPSVRSEGFIERLNAAPFSSLFAFRELDRALQNGFVWGIAAIAAVASLSTVTGGPSLAFLVALAFFRLLAEERQSMKVFLLVSLVSVGLGFSFLLVNHAFELAGLAALLRVLFATLLSESLKVVVLAGLWILRPQGSKKDFFVQPIDGILYGIMCGIGLSVVPIYGSLSTALSLEIIFSEALFGGFLGYFVGLARFRKKERASLLFFGVLVSVVLQLVFAMVQYYLSPFGALLLFAGYFVLFSYIIKQKLLERG